MVNKPCFSCFDEFLQNPSRLVIVLTCACLLISSISCSIRKYVLYTKKPPEHIARSTFARERLMVMSPDSVHDTTWKQDVKHRLRYDYSLGGICCQLEGDPFDWSQRAVVFVTTMIVSLMVSLLFFQPKEPDCREVCSPPVDELGQFLEDEPLVCEEVCVDPPKKGILVPVFSALISTPIVFGLGWLFAWLRKPVVEAVEPDGVQLKQLMKRIANAKRGVVNVVDLAQKQISDKAEGVKAAVADKADDVKKAVDDMVSRHLQPNCLAADRLAFGSFVRSFVSLPLSANPKALKDQGWFQVFASRMSASRLQNAF